jgi:hypothetical protein
VDISSAVNEARRRRPADHLTVPDLPDIVAYLHALEPRVIGKSLQRVRLSTPFLRSGPSVPG